MRIAMCLIDDDGATMVEYAILVSLIAAVCIAIIALIGANVDKLYDALNRQL